MQQRLCCSGGNGLYHVICEGGGGCFGWSGPLIAVYTCEQLSKRDKVGRSRCSAQPVLRRDAQRLNLCHHPCVSLTAHPPILCHTWALLLSIKNTLRSTAPAPSPLSSSFSTGGGGGATKEVFSTSHGSSQWTAPQRLSDPITSP